MCCFSLQLINNYNGFATSSVAEVNILLINSIPELGYFTTKLPRLPKQEECCILLYNYKSFHYVVFIIKIYKILFGINPRFTLIYLTVCRTSVSFLELESSKLKLLQ